MKEPKTLRILNLEESPSDTELIRANLLEGGIDCEVIRVQTREDFAAALEKNGFDLVLSDYTLPSFDGLSALEMTRKLRPEVPFILVSGPSGEELAIESIKSGAADYVPKHRLERLAPAVRRAMREAEERGERRRAQEALRRSEEEYRAMFELAGVGKAQLDPATERFLRVNPKMSEITGYSSEELLGMTLSDVAHPDDWEEGFERFRRMARGETPEYGGEKRYVRKDGRIIWVSVNATLVSDEPARPPRAVATIQDITERKRADEELAWLASFPRLNPSPTIEATVAGEPTYLNPAAKERFPDLPALGRRHPVLADLESVSARIRESGGQPATREVRDGDACYQQLIYQVPKSDLLRLYNIDATERSRAEEALRESEERYRTFIKHSTEGIWRFELEQPLPTDEPEDEQIEHLYRYGYLAECNDTMAEMYGFSRAEEIAGARVADLLPRSVVENVEHWRAFICSGYRIADTESHETDRWGNTKRFLNNLAGVVENGSLGQVWGTRRDVSERRKIEAALRQSEELYRTVVEQAAENIFLVDAETERILEANAAAYRSLGYTVEELEQMTLYDIVAGDQEIIDPDTRRTLRQGGFVEGERPYRRKDGSLVDVEVSVSSISYDGREVLCVVAHDVTERKQAEEDLRHSLSTLLALREAGQILGSTLESEEVVSRLLKIMQRVSNLLAAVISVPNEDGDLRIWRSVGLEGLWHRARYASEAEAARRTALETEEHQLFLLRRPDPGTGGLAGLCLPLRARDHVAGVLEAYGPESLAESGTVGILTSLANQAASALENARLYGELQEREHRLQELVGKILVAQEEERRRVAYEVHDGLAQVAVAAHQHLQAFSRRYPPDTERSRSDLERVLRLVRRTVSDARKIIANLRPTALDDFGLAAAVSLEVERLREDGYRVDYEGGLGDERLPATVEIALFRVAQEALTNARKHAQTRRVCIELRRRGNGARLEVRDYGRGFDPIAASAGNGPGERVGLAGMRERVNTLGGKLEISSRPGAGTYVVAEVPLPAMDPG